MPRTAKPQANRSDLLTEGPTGKPLPGMGQANGQATMTPTGLPYGENQALAQAQQAVPVGGSPAPPPGPPQNPLQAAKNYQMPNAGLMDPSARPSEPVTAGLPGSPATPGVIPQNAGTISAMLTKMAAATGAGALSSLAARAQQVGQ